jgi:hypothetical protein
MARTEIKYCNSYSRLPRILELCETMSLSDALTLLGEEWSVCDNVAESADLLD